MLTTEMIINGNIIFIYFLAVNIILFIMMGIDKRRAVKRGYRIPESTLLIIGIIGGGFGGFLSMSIFKHKTKKFRFYAVFFGSMILYSFTFWIMKGKI